MHLFLPPIVLRVAENPALRWRLGDDLGTSTAPLTKPLRTWACQASRKGLPNESEEVLAKDKLGLSTFQFRYTSDYHLLSAAAVLNTVPMLIAFIVLRRRIMESVALTGLKG
jgi:ABC-type glycerol-3-phosphate transport system permease component